MGKRRGNSVSKYKQMFNLKVIKGMQIKESD